MYPIFLHFQKGFYSQAQPIKRLLRYGFTWKSSTGLAADCDEIFPFLPPFFSPGVVGPFSLFARLFLTCQFSIMLVKAELEGMMDG